MNASSFVKFKIAALLVGVLVGTCLNAHSQDYGKFSTIELEVQVSENPNRITLSWPLRTDLKSYSLQRKANGSSPTTVSLAASSTGYTDTAVTPGVVYDYKVLAAPVDTTFPSAYGGAQTGIKVAMTEDRGGVLILAESVVAGQLAPEIQRLADDLAGDGYSVSQITVLASETPVQVKEKIRQLYLASANLKSVIILGHVAVPYSGNINPDGHTEHKGAWPCDGYYGDMDVALWTDVSVNNTTAAWVENRNVPGDGKFDQSTFPSVVEVAVGRVDFSNLPAFSLTETQLLRRYLDRNHAFRTGALEVARCGVVDDNLPTLKEALSATSRRAFTASFGRAGCIEADFLTHGQPRMWGCGVGYGSFTSIDGVATTSSLAAGSVQTVFNMFFGSYYGDWNNQNNILRSIIAAEGCGLGSIWSGRPNCIIYQMGLGKTMGECIRGAMNQTTDTYLHLGYNVKSVHLGLMGDPTLRMHYAKPARNVAVEATGGTALVSWSPSLDGSVEGYHVYAETPGQGFVKKNGSLITGNSFSDAGAAVGTRYMVRAVKLESASGTYYNGSTGTLAISVAGAAALHPVDAWKQQCFGSTTGAGCGDQDDADRDGASNLMEYAMGTNPLDASSKENLTNMKVEQSAQGRVLTAEFCQCSTATGAVLSVECSQDLAHWQPAAPAQVTATSGGLQLMKASVQAAGARCFLRVRVQRN